MVSSPRSIFCRLNIVYKVFIIKQQFWVWFRSSLQTFFSLLLNSLIKLKYRYTVYSILSSTLVCTGKLREHAGDTEFPSYMYDNFDGSICFLERIDKTFTYNGNKSFLLVHFFCTKLNFVQEIEDLDLESRCREHWRGREYKLIYKSTIL